MSAQVTPPERPSKIIYDLALGYSELNEADLYVIRQYLFQRLRRITQLSAQHLFPSATHNRFSHSLGVMQIGARAFARLRSSRAFDSLARNPDGTLTGTEDALTLDEVEQTARYAFLLHDLGHTPLSHVCEVFLD